MIKEFKITKKIKLTPDVFEIHYESSQKLDLKPGQFITFILPWIWWRAYSILEQSWNISKLIIKRVNIENWWRWGSIFLCDAKIWDKFKWVWPAGHFILKEEDNNKLFIWTGTWLVPLYNQIVVWLERWDKSKYILIFWIRTEKDIFYKENFEKISKKYSNFKYHIYLSREEVKWTKKGYVTNFLEEKNINFKEFYICWAPAMVNSSIEKLEVLWVNKESILFEKY